jgi:hypothetical protein
MTDLHRTIMRIFSSVEVLATGKGFGSVVVACGWMT